MISVITGSPCVWPLFFFSPLVSYGIMAILFPLVCMTMLVATLLFFFLPLWFGSSHVKHVDLDLVCISYEFFVLISLLACVKFKTSVTFIDSCKEIGTNFTWRLNVKLYHVNPNLFHPHWIWLFFCISFCYPKLKYHVIVLWITDNKLVSYVVYFSLFWRQLGQRLSRKYPLKNINGELQEWEGFQYFMLPIICRKLFITYFPTLDSRQTIHH